MKSLIEKINENKKINKALLISANLGYLDIPESLEIERIVKDNVSPKEIETIIGEEGTGYPLYNEVASEETLYKFELSDSKKYTLVTCKIKGRSRKKSDSYIYVALSEEQVNTITTNKVMYSEFVKLIFDLNDNYNCDVDSIIQVLDNIKYYMEEEKPNNWVYALDQLRKGERP